MTNDQDDAHYAKVPAIDLLGEGIYKVYEAIAADKPDHLTIKHLIILFYESILPINDLIDQCGKSAAEEVENLRQDIIKAHHKIRECSLFVNAIRLTSKGVKGYSKKKDYVNKTELSSIHTNTGQMLRLALARRARKKRESLKGKGLDVGRGGQARLSFGIQKEKSIETPTDAGSEEG